MSDLQKKWVKARLNAMAAGSFDLEDGQGPKGLLAQKRGLSEVPEVGLADDDSSSASSASSMSSTGTVVPSVSMSLFARPTASGVSRGRSLEPIPWTTYFERELFLKPDKPAGGEAADGRAESVTYHAYLTSPVDKGPLFVAHHGAGSSGLSFAVLGAEIRRRLPLAGILSLDARGHGLTTVTASSSTSATTSNSPSLTPTPTPPPQPSPPLDLRLSTLASDLVTVVRRSAAAMRWAALPPIILVGHSLGGAVVTEVARRADLGAAVLGYAVLDVVEGSAMEALASMQTYLATRPQGFASVRDAVDWHVRSRTVRNSVSARTSVPGLLVCEGEAGRRRRDQDSSGQILTTTTVPEEEGAVDKNVPSSAAAEISTTQKQQQQQKAQPSPRPWRWRTDLAATQPFWQDWFVGLSKKFLEAKGGKMLLLAGTDRLDTELTIGQMQGKYALQVFPEAGHFIHEDLPEKTAIALADFYRRNDRSQLVLPPKVSELLAQGKKV